MFLADVVVSLVVALILTLCLVFLVFGWRHTEQSGNWPLIMFVFVVLFLGTWAGGVWIRPAGPVAWGVFWVPFIVVGILAALLIIAFAPRPGRSARATEQDEHEKEDRIAATHSIAKGVAAFLLLLLIIAIIAGYL